MMRYQWKFVCEERYVVVGVGSIGSGIGNGAGVGPSGVVQVPYSLPICRFGLYPSECGGGVPLVR